MESRELVTRGNEPLRTGSVERACEFVLAKVKASSGRLFHQGSRRPPLACASTAPAVRRVAEERFHRISTPVARALVSWANGFPVELLESIPTPQHVLALQARGARCMSILSDDTPTAPHADALAFALHDLCHLDKFVDPEHHRGQVGFFACLHATVSRAEWAGFESSLDEGFRLDWRHVAADMNGSAIFLFATLKMKLKMAVRRTMAVARGVEPPHHGSLSPTELSVYDERLDELLRLCDLGPGIVEAARKTSTKRDDPRSALRLLRHFEERAGVVAVSMWDNGPMLG